MLAAIFLLLGLSGLKVKASPTVPPELEGFLDFLDDYPLEENPMRHDPLSKILQNLHEEGPLDLDNSSPDVAVPFGPDGARTWSFDLPEQPPQSVSFSAQQPQVMGAPEQNEGDLANVFDQVDARWGLDRADADYVWLDEFRPVGNNVPPRVPKSPDTDTTREIPHGPDSGISRISPKYPGEFPEAAEPRMEVNGGNRNPRQDRPRKRKATAEVALVKVAKAKKQEAFEDVSSMLRKEMSPIPEEASTGETAEPINGQFVSNAEPEKKKPKLIIKLKNILTGQKTDEKSDDRPRVEVEDQVLTEETSSPRAEVPRPTPKPKPRKKNPKPLTAKVTIPPVPPKVEEPREDFDNENGPRPSLAHQEFDRLKNVSSLTPEKQAYISLIRSSIQPLNDRNLAILTSALCWFTSSKPRKHSQGYVFKISSPTVRVLAEKTHMSVEQVTQFFTVYFADMGKTFRPDAPIYPATMHACGDENIIQRNILPFARMIKDIFRTDSEFHDVYEAARSGESMPVAHNAEDLMDEQPEEGPTKKDMLKQRAEEGEALPLVEEELRSWANMDALPEEKRHYITKFRNLFTEFDDGVLSALTSALCFKTVRESQRLFKIKIVDREIGVLAAYVKRSVEDVIRFFQIYFSEHGKEFGVGKAIRLSISSHPACSDKEIEARLGPGAKIQDILPPQDSGDVEPPQLKEFDEELLDPEYAKLSSVDRQAFQLRNMDDMPEPKKAYIAQMRKLPSQFTDKELSILTASLCWRTTLFMNRKTLYYSFKLSERDLILLSKTLDRRMSEIEEFFRTYLASVGMNYELKVKKSFKEHPACSAKGDVARNLDVGQSDRVKYRRLENMFLTPKEMQNLE